jgi:hypothetical protein
MNSSEPSSPELALDRTAATLRHRIQRDTELLVAIEKYQTKAPRQGADGIQTVPAQGMTTAPTAIGPNLSLWENAVLILQQADGPLSTLAIAEIMRKANIPTKSMDFPNTLDSVLCKHQDVSLRLAPKCWGLRGRTYATITAAPKSDNVGMGA